MTEEKRLTRVIQAECEGKRLDAFLAEACPDLSRNLIQKLIDDGCITRGGKVLKKSAKTSAGDIYTVEVPEPETVSVEAEDIPLDVVFEDGDVIVVNKPRGMVVHPAPGHAGGTLVNALMHHCGDSLSGINGELRPGIVHRIDKDTSGLLIAAKNDAAHKSLAAQLKDHSLFREYDAVVYGNLKENSGTVDAPIGRHPTDRKRQAVTKKNSRNAVTHWYVTARYQGFTRVRCVLETGRTHQIRVHMAHIGHSIAGDMVYGMKKTCKGLEGQCLHAKRLTFTHPKTGDTIVCEAPEPDYFKDFVAKLGPEIN